MHLAIGARTKAYSWWLLVVEVWGKEEHWQQVQGLQVHLQVANHCQVAPSCPMHASA